MALGFVGDAIRDGVDIVEEVVAKPLTELFEGIVEVGDRVGSDIIHQTGEAIGRTGAAIDRELKISETVKGVSRAGEKVAALSDVSLVEDAKLPTNDPRGQRSSRGAQSSTSGSLIINQTKEQPTLLG